MKRVIICILLIISNSAVAASAKKRQPPQQQQSWQDVFGKTYSPTDLGNLALNQVCWDWRPEGWVIEFLPGVKGYLGMTYWEDHKIVIWIRPEHSPEEVAGTLVHELSHVFAEMYLTPTLRMQWRELRELPDDIYWYPKCDGCSDFGAVTGDFAESVSWALQGPSAGFRSRLGLPPNQAQQIFIRKLISRE